MDRPVRCRARIDVELFQQAAEADAGAGVTDADADRAILVMDAQGDHRPLEPRIGHPGHCKQQLARKKGRLNHMLAMAPPHSRGKA